MQKKCIRTWLNSLQEMPRRNKKSKLTFRHLMEGKILKLSWSILKESASIVMKLRILLERVKADFLSDVKARINVSLATIRMIMTYSQAIATFRQTVHDKYPSNLLPSCPNWRIQDADSKRPTGKGNGKGSSKKQGRGKEKKDNYHRDQYPVRLTNGKTINVHPSFNFEPTVGTYYHQKLRGGFVVKEQPTKIKWLIIP